MSDNIRLAPVISINVPELGHIFAEAFLDDLLRLFTFKHGPDLALSITNNQARFQVAYNNPSNRFLKIIDESTREIVGFIQWTMIEN